MLSKRDAIALFSESFARITETRGFFEAGQVPVAAAITRGPDQVQVGGVIGTRRRRAAPE
jgi:hypothetical protein